MPQQLFEILCVLKKLFLKIDFYIHFLRPYFGAPGLQNGLKLKNPVYIDELLARK